MHGELCQGDRRSLSGYSCAGSLSIYLSIYLYLSFLCVYAFNSIAFVGCFFFLFVFAVAFRASCSTTNSNKDNPINLMLYSISSLYSISFDLLRHVPHSLNFLSFPKRSNCLFICHCPPSIAAPNTKWSILLLCVRWMNCKNINGRLRLHLCVYNQYLDESINIQTAIYLFHSGVYLSLSNCNQISCNNEILIKFHRIRYRFFLDISLPLELKWETDAPAVLSRPCSDRISNCEDYSNIGYTIPFKSEVETLFIECNVYKFVVCCLCFMRIDVMCNDAYEHQYTGSKNLCVAICSGRTIFMQQHPNNH